MKDTPLISIVIANYNYGRFLEDAMRSIFIQADADGLNDEVELIVVDGGSTDNSVEIIKKYADRISWWVSERDRGQSDAFNKGFAKARGKYLTWLNADDVLVSGCLKRVISQMKRHPDCQWFTGNLIRFLESDKSLMQVEWGPNWYPGFLQRRNSPIVSYGPTTFFGKELYERVGRIDESCNLIMDSDLWLRFMAAGVKQRRVRCLCWAFRMHEASKTAEFDGHTGSAQGLSELALERRRSAERVGYKPSRFLRMALMGWRVLDGSLLWRLWIRLRYGKYHFDVSSGRIV